MPAPIPALPERAMITFAVTPAGAIVEVDGVRQQGPLLVDRSERAYEVRISAPGHQTAVFNLAGDRDRHFEVALEKIPPPPAEPRRPRARKKSKPRKLPDGLVGGGEL
jgi:hypothetical protein